MTEPTPDLPATRSWLRLPEKVDFRRLLKAALKAAGAGSKLARGDLLGAFEDAVAAFEGAEGIESAQRRAAKLVSRALAGAMVDLIDDHRHHFAPVPEAPLPGLDEDALAVDLVLDRDFFERPESLPALDALRPALATWLEAHGRAEHDGLRGNMVRARAIADRLGPYYAAALAREYRARHEHYADVWQVINSPVTGIERRARDWRAWHARLVRWPDQPLFADTFSLRQVYQPLRAWWLDRGEAGEGDDFDDRPRRGVRREDKRIVVDVTDTLHQWLEEETPGDAIRVVSGGPGAGKSSLARMIAADRARLALAPRAPSGTSGGVQLARTYRVMLIELHHFDLHGDLKEAIAEYGRDVCRLHDDPFAHLDADPLLLIFDGLDELALRGDVGRRSVVDLVSQVEHLVERLNVDGPRLRALLLGREVVIQSLEAYCRRRQRLLHLLPYAIRQDERSELTGLQDHIEHDQRDDWWRAYAAMTGEALEGLPPELARDRLSELTAEPLLNYLVAITRAEGEVDFAAEGTSLLDVYDDLVRKVYDRVHARRPGDADDKSHGLPVARKVSETEFRRFLEAIAVAAWHGDGRLATASQIRAQLSESLRGKLDTLNDGAQDGISRLVAAFYFRPHRGPTHAEPTFEFTHQGFAECLLARHILRFMQRLDREYRARLVDDESGWSIRDCLLQWARVFGPSPLTPHVFDFIRDGLASLHRREPERVERYQTLVGVLIGRVLRADFPLEAIPGQVFHAQLAQSRNAGEALIVCASACHRVTGRTIDVDAPTASTLGTWLRRLQPQRISTANSMALAHLGGLMLPGHLLDFADLGWIDLERADLARLSLVGANCSWINLRQANLKDANLFGVNFVGANFSGANLSGANLEEAKLAGAQLGGANLSGAHLGGTNLEDATLDEASLDRANLFGVNLERASLEATSLVAANLFGANLVAANLVEANLEGASLSGADLCGANLVGANLTGVDLSGANLTAVVSDVRTRWPSPNDAGRPAEGGVGSDRLRRHRSLDDGNSDPR